jgi:hypothetical protein
LSHLQLTAPDGVRAPARWHARWPVQATARSQDPRIGQQAAPGHRVIEPSWTHRSAASQ